MRHFEIALLIHPDQSEQVPAMLDRYTHLIEEHKGAVHRLENCGRRQLAYSIEKVHKAHYIIMNIECDQETLKELEHSFKFSDAVLRYLVLRRDHAITEASPLTKEVSRYVERARAVTERAPSRVEKPERPEKVSEESTSEKEGE